jgi:hypothetical protein
MTQAKLNVTTHCRAATIGKEIERIDRLSDEADLRMIAASDETRGVFCEQMAALFSQRQQAERDLASVNCRGAAGALAQLGQIRLELLRAEYASTSDRALADALDRVEHLLRSVMGWAESI